MKTFERTYRFNRIDFDNDGSNKQDGKFFLDLIHDWEKNFNKEFYPFFANCIFANSSTMILIKNCFISAPNEDFGMDLIDGKIDIDKNLKIETYSSRETTYAIGSEIQGNKDEPLYLIIDDKIGDGIVIYKYIPDDDTDDTEPDMPLDKDIREREVVFLQKK